MALICSSGALCLAAIFCIACAACGRAILRAAGLERREDLEYLLCSLGVGVIGYEAAVALAEFAVQPRLAVLISLILLLAGAVPGLRGAWQAIAGIFGRVKSGSRTEHALATAFCALILFQGLVAMAPLTGSDALHYHFTVPLLTLRDGFVPNFPLVHSFFTGQGHLLILTGLALHSEKLSLALIFLGGVLAAAASASLARQWLSREWAWLCALCFLLTPVVFWQASTAGAPDILMAFFAAIGVLVVARARNENRFAITILAGAFAGSLAGAKYTGCLFACALMLAFLVEARSFRRLGLFFSAALATGMWPYVRNMLWIHDPVFPFLLKWFAPGEMNSFTLASVLADTGASALRSIPQTFLFPLFAAVDQAHPGFWQFFGPLPLTFLLFSVLAWRNTPVWRVASIVWLTSSVLVCLSSGMLRFLLPVFPVALAAALAGAASLRRADWPMARALSSASIAALLALCIGGALFYGRLAALASVGLLSRESYLELRAPDYRRVSFINQTLAGQGSEGKTLVFLQHLYYLRVPFVSGNPNHNWNIDPQRFASVEAWDALFRAENIRWVVRAPDYPLEVAAPLQQLESEGRLVPVARAEVSDFDGLRLYGARKTASVVILRVKE